MTAFRHSPSANEMISTPARTPPRPLPPSWLAKTAALLPLERWPPWLGNAYELKVPQTILRLPSATTACPANINIVLHLLASIEGRPGDVVECGVFRGGTLLPMALRLRKRRQDRRIIGFDSFEGFDESISKDISMAGGDHQEKHVGGFKNTSLELVMSKAKALGISDKIDLIPGFFRDTLPDFGPRDLSFVHIDCDIYESYLVCLKTLYSMVVPGGIILFDEYEDPRWPGCKQAVDSFLVDRAERPRKIEMNNHIKFYIEKA